MTAPAVAAQLAMAADAGGDWLSFLRRTRRHEPGDTAGMVVDESSELAPRGLCACAVFLVANLVSAAVSQYETLLIARFIASLAGAP